MHFGDRQTDRRTNRWRGPAALAITIIDYLLTYLLTYLRAEASLPRTKFMRNKSLTVLQQGEVCELVSKLSLRLSPNDTRPHQRNLRKRCTWPHNTVLYRPIVHADNSVRCLWICDCNAIIKRRNTESAQIRNVKSNQQVTVTRWETRLTVSAQR